jgi:hypothetical protein
VSRDKETGTSSRMNSIRISPEPQEVEIGVHGLVVAHGGRFGLPLPLVPSNIDGTASLHRADLPQGGTAARPLAERCDLGGVPPRKYLETGNEIARVETLISGVNSNSFRRRVWLLITILGSLFNEV